MEQAFTYPYLDIYMVTQINQDVEKQNEIINDLKKDRQAEEFPARYRSRDQKRHPGEDGARTVCDHPHFPAFAPRSDATPFKKIFNYSDKQYKQVLIARKELILKMLFR
ncbi:hypothetical protein [Paraflavitalea speifideaquila]|uniref:hypothetical protein n=1 Tax=Paraflavitalea speifideaquila TaxID=3076558 RepID=UPI0028EA99BE|nr:hypothetical protein [Paraflavitalea speifideiaquila]